MGKTHRKSKSWGNDDYDYQDKRSKTHKLQERRNRAKMKHIMREQDHDVLTREENY